jgi:hypothetical protein
MLAQPAGLACEAGTPDAPGVMVATALAVVVVARGRTALSGTRLDRARVKRDARQRSSAEDFMLKLGIRGVGL